MGRVQDQVAVVTGAANGLGQAIAQRLAQEGARVVLGDMDASGLERTAEAITATGAEARTVVGDLTEEETASRLIQTCAVTGSLTYALPRLPAVCLVALDEHFLLDRASPFPL